MRDYTQQPIGHPSADPQHFLHLSGGQGIRIMPEHSPVAGCSFFFSGHGNTSLTFICN